MARQSSTCLLHVQERRPLFDVQAGAGVAQFMTAIGQAAQPLTLRSHLWPRWESR